MKIEMQLKSISPDRTQYKPYSPVIQGIEDKPIVVVFNVPNEYFDGDSLTPAGIAYLCAVVADELDTMHDLFRRKSRSL